MPLKVSEKKITVVMHGTATDPKMLSLFLGAIKVS